eukprot:CAMPEP_0184686286 /NCGR_PEP_ID=MMETSP0312-20130426/21912_1 /TAXON_ID=31354 /ORGANISM="Compsopogon coeruleus, Strain SAG 36.94" /LENGTH=719 /DNA_ID=CAMNT_0027141217 /DNA_START=46 /DNA_END=2205 /DNA_ORIENTATION=+
MAKRRRDGTEHPRKGERQNYEEADRMSQVFEQYYREQSIASDEEDFRALLDILALPLPSAFRITASSRSRDLIREQLESKFTTLLQNSGMSPPIKLPWYPDNLGWTVDAPRFALRKDDALKEFHNFLITQNNIGLINRQEAVSMIPPLVLDVSPGMRVVDLCAAPGSKTAQLLDMLQGGCASPPTDEGLIVANDADVKRCWMLAHQLKRFSYPSLVVTSHSAVNFPAFEETFDRVLCDVPCSGDGTLRKAPDLWAKWNPQLALGLHRLQNLIARRGFELLKDSGLMVYSTCSFNPLENEAVVLALLRRFQGSIELVDSDRILPGLKRRKGMQFWKVPDFSSKGSSFFTSFADVPEHRRKRVVQTLFPPEKDEDSLRDVLPRCMRIMPHDQNTGGFFVAILRKTNSSTNDTTVGNSGNRFSSVRAPAQSHGTEEDESRITGRGDEEDEIEEKTTEMDQSAGQEMTGDQEPVKDDRASSRLFTDDPMVLLKERDPTASQTISEFYGIDAEVLERHFMTRGTGNNSKKIYFVSESVREIALRSVRASGVGDIRIVHGGVRILESCKREGQQSFRIAAEGAWLMKSLVSKRVVVLARDQFRWLMHAELPLPLTSVEVSSAREVLSALSVGPCLFVDSDENEAVSGWRGRRSLDLMVSREELGIIRHRLPVIRSEMITTGDEGTVLEPPPSREELPSLSPLDPTNMTELKTAGRDNILTAVEDA